MKIFLIFSILFLILEGCSGGKQNAEIANKELFNLDEAFVKLKIFLIRKEG